MQNTSNVNLPENFVEKVLEHARGTKVTLRDAIDEAILAVLHRPLTSQEKWAIIDQAACNSPHAKLKQEVIDRIARGGRH